MIGAFKAWLGREPANGAVPAAAATGAAVPDGQRIYAIGDVHGRLDLLTALLGRVEDDDAARAPARTTIVMLGDLVDRGPDSSGVIEHLATRDWGGRQVRMIKGNHEEMFLLAHGGDAEAMRHWMQVGGEATLESYGVPRQVIERGTALDIIAAFASRVPDRHLALLQGMAPLWRAGDYCFVHAGVRPGVAINRQKATDLLWIRREFLDYEGDFGAVIVHGHSISLNVEEYDNRIGIDTGAYKSGRLTALALEGARRWYLDNEQEAAGQGEQA